MAALRRLRVAGRERLTGEGRVTLTRTGGAAPGWGAYVLLYTTRQVDRRREAIIAAARPTDTDPAWGLHEPRPHGPQGNETRPLRAWATAVTPPKGKAESVAAYNERLALHLLTTGYSARLVLSPTSVDLPVALWEVEVDGAVDLPPVKDRQHGFAGHHTVRIGRLISVTSKET
ncbi:hypothetical protein [Streptomyces caniscabiei]|uniref:hypothetical protein n=1 Tax=Streptomyces caniscabiei TaxID=2746961 RepID=UPI000A361601|nr:MULTISPECIES: hypothetical protein [Streptomyces]MBP5866108.1 hypothetical protein [Streptomyces sp. LBUM 1484]MBP5880754.1 hypothetical protein [Streptomyces sp. LBUM 1477]